jgi:hypothetical protein|tara:strand:+ start:16836 stop:17522 length:687 start_codon:yes stop_codon:yes gene_type:complete
MLTGIGSLPFVEVKTAIDYSLKHDIPFLPELPFKGEAMLDYIKNPGKLSCLEEFKKHQFNVVKVQSIGPATLILSGYSEDEAISRIYDHVSKILDGLDAGEIILFLDEPALGQALFDFGGLWQAIFSSFDVTSGVHTCGNADWDRIFETDIEILSFDASQYNPTLYPKYRSGKRIAWGVKNLEDVKDFVEGDLITPLCGLGGKNQGYITVERIFERLEMIKERIINAG